MECDVCKSKKATVFLTQIVKGEMQKVNLCEGCAQEKGVSDPTGFALADILLGFGQSKPAVEMLVPGEKQCKACGMTQSSFRKTGRLGCANCYTVFADGMDNLLKAMHKGVRHSGRVPRQGPAEGRFDPTTAAVPATGTSPEPSLEMDAANTAKSQILGNPFASTPPPAPSVKADIPPFVSTESKLEQLRLALDGAVEGEHFEDAARLLDEIRRLSDGGAEA